jgi:hypothetical protein
MLLAAVASLVSAQSCLTVETIVASGLARPVQVTHAGDGSGRLFLNVCSVRITVQ